LVLVRRVIVAAGLLGALGAAARRAYSHPLHTTLSELSIASNGSVQLVLRAFVDDLSAATLGRAGPNRLRLRRRPPFPPRRRKRRSNATCWRCRTFTTTARS